MKRQLLLGFTVAALLLAMPFAATPAAAALSADASFSVVGGNLQVVLTNTSADDVLNPSQVLTGVFFDVAGSPALTPISATLTGGSTVFFGPNGGGNVGGEWAYLGDFSALGTTFDSGISSAGFGLFGTANFNGPELEGPPNGAVNGVGYGITSAGDNLLTGNAAVTGQFPLIQNQVTFLLSGISGTFSISDISNIRFVYGTDLNEQPVPEPGTFLLLGSGLIGLAGWGRKKFQK